PVIHHLALEKNSYRTGCAPAVRAIWFFPLPAVTCRLILAEAPRGALRVRRGGGSDGSQETATRGQTIGGAFRAPLQGSGVHRSDGAEARTLWRRGIRLPGVCTDASILLHLPGRQHARARRSRVSQ